MEQKPEKKDVLHGMKKLVSMIYHFISVMSTLAIFSAVALFFFGRTLIGDNCDDDLIMTRIKEQIPDNLTISKIYMQDIHGFGNESIIVLACGDCVEGSDGLGQSLTTANQLLIFDKIDNSILNQIYNLYGLGSNYKLSCIFSLVDPYAGGGFFWGYSLDLIDTVELTGDLSKEIVVKFQAEPAGTAGNYKIGIFSYSFEQHCYYMLGTFPPSKEYQRYKDDDWLPGSSSTTFHESGETQTNYYDNSKSFHLGSVTEDDIDFFICTEYSTYLVRTLMIWDDKGHNGPHRHVVSVFAPIYDPITDELEWRVYFSQETEEEGYPTKEFVMNFLREKTSY